MIEKVKAEIPELCLIEVDITQQPEIAVKYRVMATPAIAINGRLEFTGVPKEGVLRNRIAEIMIREGA
jgi:hypothetical protein